MALLFENAPDRPTRRELAAGAVILHGFVGSRDEPILAEIRRIRRAAPFRHMQTPGGGSMSAAMTSCGAYGWVTDPTGYRYEPTDPRTGEPWPPMPELFSTLAREAAAEAGFPGFEPDSCLINRYDQGARMGMHRDADERSFDAPIVSVSLGVSAVFLFGGLRRRDKPDRLRLEHGDVVVFGGDSRMRYHGVQRIEHGAHPLTGSSRINLTLRRAR